MTYNACNLASEIDALLLGAGYIIEPVTPGEDSDCPHCWDLGTAGVGGMSNTRLEASECALVDAFARLRELQSAAARVIAAFDVGDGSAQSAARLDLNDALDACIPGDVASFINAQLMPN